VCAYLHGEVKSVIQQDLKGAVRMTPLYVKHQMLSCIAVELEIVGQSHDNETLI
jgi:hypothetical protein